MINNLTLVGEIVSSPEVREIENGKLAASFKVVTTSKHTKKDTGETKTRKEIHHVNVYDKLAEIVEYLIESDKLIIGATVYVSGEIRKDRYERDGKDMIGYFVMAEKIRVI